MAVVQDTRNALWRRDEQLKRWEQSETCQESHERDINASKIKFNDGCVFLAACSSGDKDEVQRLLDKGADINTANIDGLTALHQACIDDNIDMVEYLIQRGADIDACDNEGWTALHATSSCGFTEVARYLIENGADLAAVNNEGDLPIDLADGNDMEDLISDEMDAKDIDADAARNEEEQVILRDANQWLNGTYAETPHPKTGATSLHVAAAKGYMNVMNILIQAGADIDAKDFDGWTPLHAAAHWGQKEACKLLVQNFCNMEVKNQVGQTAIDIADSDTEPLLKELKKEQASLKKDRDENSLQNDNATRNVPPLKRRSSVTRMSVKQKDKVVQETAKDERESLRQAHQMVEEKDEDRSGSKSSEEEAASSGIESSSEESESANSPSIDTEKQNEINRQSSLKSIPQVNGEVKDKNGESESIDTKSSLSISDPPVTPPPKAEVVPPTSPPPKADSPVPPSPVDSPKSPLAPIKEKKTSHEDEEEVKKEDILRKKDTTKENEDSDDIFSRRTKSEIETSLTYDRPRGHSSLNRAASIPAGLLRPQVSTKLPLTKSESLDTAPSSWRAGLRKTGSSSTVSEVTVTDPEKIPRSASSSWLASSDQKHDTEPRLKIHSTSQDGKSRFNDLYSRYSSLVTAAPPTASTTTGSSKRTSAPATSSATTTSSAYTYTPYVPLSRRRPISDISDIGEKSRDLSLLAKGGVPDRQIATVGGCTSPGATGQRRSFEPPKRDEEKEVERKAKAKRARESRRSTQGVTKEDLEKAEQALNAADNGQTRTGQVHSLDAHRGSATDDRSNKENSQPDQDSVSSVSRSSSSSSTCSTAKARGTSSIEDKKEAEDSTSHVSSYRRPRDILTDNSSSLSGYRGSSSRLSSAAPTLSTVGSTATTTVISSSTPSTTPFKTPLYRSKYLSSRPPLEADEDSHDESRNAEKEDPSQKSAAIRARRKRDSRRPTGKVTLEDLPLTDESRKTREDVRKEDDKMLSSQRYGGSRYSADSIGGGSTTSLNDAKSTGKYSGAGRSDRPSSYTPGSSSAYSRPYSSMSLPDSKDNSVDYKKLYEEEKLETEKLRRDVSKLQQDLRETRTELDKQRKADHSLRSGSADSIPDRRFLQEKRALERKISEQEEELRAMESLRSDNQRLKEENGALIRVISKLSK